MQVIELYLFYKLKKYYQLTGLFRGLDEKIYMKSVQPGTQLSPFLQFSPFYGKMFFLREYTIWNKVKLDTKFWKVNLTV